MIFDVKTAVSEVLKARAEKGGVKNVFFVACGGSFAALFAAKYFLQSEARDLRVEHYSSNEFCQATPKCLGENSIVVACSFEGKTPETVKAAEISRQAGAAVFALTGFVGSPLAQNGDYVLDFGREATNGDVSLSSPGYALRVAVEILNQVEGFKYYDQMQDGFQKINKIVTEAKEFCEPRAQVFAETHKNDKLIYTMASGASYGNAYQFAICLLMEMQWINSSAIHSGEYFHGPFEITDRSLPFIVLMSEGRTRLLDQRALDFLRRFGERLTILDAKELGINKIPDAVSEFFNPFIFASCLRVYGQALAAAREHPLSVRRYMWKLQY